jgi:immune inhibitor A
VPDYYDTTDGDNSVGYWSLMDSGSWLGHGNGTIGTTPNHMGAPTSCSSAGTAPTTSQSSTAPPRRGSSPLGPSYHANHRGAQAVAVNLPQGTATIDVVEPAPGVEVPLLRQR